MKQKDMNMIMAAVAVLVMLKTMVNSAFRKQEIEHDNDALEFNVLPGRVSDMEYEYLNDLLEKDDFDFEQLKIEDFENLNFQKLMKELNSNLEVKVAIMKNSKVLKELLLKGKTEEEFGIGEAVSDS